MLKRLKTYSFLSLPYYSLDYLGFHVPAFRRLAKFKLTYYRLYDGTQFIFRFFTNDRCIIDEIFINKAYTPNPTFEIRSGDVVVDLGAHIGVFTVFAARHARGVKVYCYEPLPENFELLKANVRLNKLGDRVKMFQLAVADKRSFSPLYIGDTGLASLNLQSGKHVVAKVIRLEDVAYNNNLDRIDFLKVDVEGAEYDIFRNVDKDVLRSVRRIAMECHSLRNAVNLKNLLRNSGFTVSIRESGHSSLSYIYAVRSKT